MSSSQARRDPMPARARTFWTRSAVGVGCELGGIGLLDRGRVVGEPQSPLERLDDARVRDEVAERREVAQRVETESFEEHRRGAVENGGARSGITTGLLDVAALDQRAQRRLDVDAADRRDLTA